MFPCSLTNSQKYPKMQILTDNGGARLCNSGVIKCIAMVGDLSFACLAIEIMLCWFDATLLLFELKAKQS
ncbi:hypothetical protein DC889_24695 [Vibrio parahaemolyticus]|nr:hypothetical protein [Vibrio parahaemolyticus]